MCGLNVLHALILETSGYTVISKQRWRTIAGSRQSALWRIGVRALYSTSAVRQRHQHVSTRTRVGNDNGSGDACGSIKLQREKSTLSSGNERASFGVAEARAYCALLLRKHDSAAFTLQTFIPGPARDAYLALRTFNIEIARVPDVTSNSTIGAMRLQFWRDAVRRALGSDGPSSQQDGHNGSDINHIIRTRANAEPVAILLASAVEDLRARTQPTSSSSAGFSPHNNGYSMIQDPTRTWYPWLNRMITAREQYLNNQPYPTLEALEDYAENTYSVLMYLCLSALPVSSVEVDHVASHIGKAMGIATVLRGLPFLAFPSQSAGPAAWPLPSFSWSSDSSTISSSPSPSSPSSSQSSTTDQQPPPDDHNLMPPNTSNNIDIDTNSNPTSQHQGSVPLPLDILSSTNVREEDVFRCGSSAPNLRDAVFKVASRAHEHLITAHEMLESIRATSKSPSPDSTNTNSISPTTDASSPDPASDSSTSSLHAGSSSPSQPDIDRAFGVLIQAVPTHLWLKKLQRVDFDVFDPRVRRQDWRLPWKAYWAYKRGRWMDA